MVRYDERIDEEVIEICDLMNSLPGIETYMSCCGHGFRYFWVSFKVTNQVGLYILGSCTNHRNFKYGDDVGISLDASHSEIWYFLTTGNLVGEAAYKAIRSLIENIRYHLSHDTFRRQLEGIKG